MENLRQKVNEAAMLRSRALMLLGPIPEHSNTCNMEDPESGAPCNCGAKERLETYAWVESLIEKEFARVTGGPND